MGGRGGGGGRWKDGCTQAIKISELVSKLSSCDNVRKNQDINIKTGIDLFFKTTLNKTPSCGHCCLHVHPVCRIERHKIKLHHQNKNERSIFNCQTVYSSNCTHNCKSFTRYEGTQAKTEKQIHNIWRCKMEGAGGRGGVDTRNDSILTVHEFSQKNTLVPVLTQNWWDVDANTKQHTSTSVHRWGLLHIYTNNMRIPPPPSPSQFPPCLNGHD